MNLDDLSGLSLLWNDGNVIRGRIFGSLPSIKNGRRLVRIRGRVIPIKSEEAIDYVETIQKAVSLSRVKEIPLDCEKMELTVNVWPSSMRPDLECELLPDCLQKAGVIKNDRAIWRKVYERVAVDKESPRIEFAIRPM